MGKRGYTEVLASSGESAEAQPEAMGQQNG